MTDGLGTDNIFGVNTYDAVSINSGLQISADRSKNDELFPWHQAQKAIIDVQNVMNTSIISPFYLLTPAPNPHCHLCYVPFPFS